MLKFNRFKKAYCLTLSLIIAITALSTGSLNVKAKAASSENELNYFEKSMYPEKVITLRSAAKEVETEKGAPYITLQSDNTLSINKNSEEAAKFELYSFGDGTYALKSIENGKYLSLKAYKSEDEKVIKADADLVGWNERFIINENSNGQIYITSHYTYNRDESNRNNKYRRVSLVTYKEQKHTLSLNAEEPAEGTDLFIVTEDNSPTLYPRVYPTVSGNTAILKWNVVEGYSSEDNYSVKVSSKEGTDSKDVRVTINDHQVTAVVDKLSSGKDYDITVSTIDHNKVVASTEVPIRIFEHPGIMHSTEELDALKYHIENKMEPWYSDWLHLRNSVSSNLSSLDFYPKPHEGVGRGNPSDSGNMGDFEKSGQAAYLHALKWVVTGDSRHADKVVEILNAWAYQLQVIDGRDNILGAGLNAYKFANAAEIIRYYNGGYEAYKDEDFKQLQSMMINVVYPVIQDAGIPMIANGNWDTAAYLSMISIGVLCDNMEIFNRAINFYKSPEINGSIKNYIIVTGQTQESGRDQAHAQLGIGTMAMTAEVAWQQGIDLYSLENNRLYKAFEYSAKHNLFYDVSFEPVPNIFGRTDQWAYWPDRLDQQMQVRGEFRDIYELALSHYQGRMGLSAEWTQKAAEAMRPEGYVHIDGLGFGTLTKYAGEPTEQPRPRFKIRTREGSMYERQFIQLPDGTYTAETKESYLGLQPDHTLAITAKYADAPYFELHTFEDGSYALKSLANNKYLSVKADDQYVIKADAESVGKNEKFKFYGNGNGINYLTFPGLDNRRVSLVDSYQGSNGTSDTFTLSLNATTPKKDMDMFVFMYNHVQPDVLISGGIRYIHSLDMKEGIKHSLSAKLNSALRSIEDENQKASINKMGAVMNEINAQKGKSLNTNQANELNRLMNDTIKSIHSAF